MLILVILDLQIIGFEFPLYLVATGPVQKHIIYLEDTCVTTMWMNKAVRHVLQLQQGITLESEPPSHSCHQGYL